MKEVIWVSDRSEFQDLLDTEDFLVVDFTAPSWCRPCQQFAPHFEAAAQSATFRSDMLGRTTFVAVDVDDADWAMVDYGVRGVPTVKFFAGGEPVQDLKERVAPKLLSEISDIYQNA